MAEIDWEVLENESRRRAEDIGFKGRIRKTVATQEPQPPIDDRERYTVTNTPDYSSDKSRRERIRGK